MTYTKNPYKTVSYTPKGLAAQMIHDHCRWEGYSFLRKNPQDLIRDALVEQGIIQKKQMNAGDRSNWEPGEAIKVSLYSENMNDLDDMAERLNCKRQQVIEEAVITYLNNLK